ncbi:MAG: hypothetical protein FJ086_01885 [Deltaproteobacteria bacterium]|nr:hypothetical protein [Deltaproteobacteria bacterium]
MGWLGELSVRRIGVGAVRGAATATCAFFLFAFTAPVAMPAAAVAALLPPGVGATVGIQTAPDDVTGWATPPAAVTLRI